MRLLGEHAIAFGSEGWLGLAFRVLLRVGSGCVHLGLAEADVDGFIIADGLTLVSN